VDEVVAGTNQMQCALAHSILDEWVGVQISKGHIDSLLHSIHNCRISTYPAIEWLVNYRRGVPKG
jgi:hypothetical protein